MEKIAVDDSEKNRSWQGFTCPHQILRPEPPTQAFSLLFFQPAGQDNRENAPRFGTCSPAWRRLIAEWIKLT